MGYFSDLAIREAEQTLNLKGIAGKKVCSDCFVDPHTAVVEFMLPQIELEYASADQTLPRDPETKDRMFGEEEFGTRDMLESYIGLELPNDQGDILMEDIAGALPEQDWCLVHPLTTRPHKAIDNSWAAFKTIVQHRRRFFVLQHKDKELEYDLDWGDAAYDLPGLLERIGRFTLDHGLIVRLGAGSRWVRVQQMKDGEHDFGPLRMGPPPYEKADTPNRMSPAGIPMFYGAEDLETALAEVADDRARFASGTFEALKDVMILDVRKAPEVPSLFDPEHARDRAVATFMHSFIGDFCAPIDRKKRPHVDYLPTQIVTEYFRTSVLTADREPILGVLYASTKNGRDAIVLFAENGDVVDGAPDAEPLEGEWLRMVGYQEVDHVPAAAAPDAATAGTK